MNISKYDPSVKWKPLDLFDIKKDGPARMEMVKNMLAVEMWIKEGHNHKKESLYISMRGWMACERTLQVHFMILGIIKEIKNELRKKGN